MSFLACFHPPLEFVLLVVLFEGQKPHCLGYPEAKNLVFSHNRTHHWLETTLASAKVVCHGSVTEYTECFIPHWQIFKIVGTYFGLY